MTVSDQIELSCLLEATARKPGNVHPGARFTDLGYTDFVAAAERLRVSLEQSLVQRVALGSAILSAVQATQSVTSSNANLGIILLVTPLAMVSAGTRLRDGLSLVLRQTTVTDSTDVFEAIRLARPGGLGEAPEQDVHSTPTLPLHEVMALAADRDLVAQQYATNFRLVESAAIRLGELWAATNEDRCLPVDPAAPVYSPWEWAIIHLACELMAAHPDTLIARKCGLDTALEAARRAQHVVASATATRCREFQEFDVWLRADGHRRNPGTTADLIAACLFWAIREGYVIPPSKSDVLQQGAEIAARSTFRA